MATVTKRHWTTKKGEKQSAFLVTGTIDREIGIGGSSKQGGRGSLSH